jgi:hypothetical protein
MGSSLRIDFGGWCVRVKKGKRGVWSSCAYFSAPTVPPRKLSRREHPPRPFHKHSFGAAVMRRMNHTPCIPMCLYEVSSSAFRLTIKALVYLALIQELACGKNVHSPSMNSNLLFEGYIPLQALSFTWILWLRTMIRYISIDNVQVSYAGQ